MAIQEKSSTIQVLGSLIKQPDLLSETNEYKIEVNDFPEKFHRIIFAAIHNLYNSGDVEVIDSVVIDGFLSQYDVQYEIFNQNKGLEYLETIQEMAEVENFDYYYGRLKKFSLIREMDGLGFDISEVYDETIMNPREAEELQKKFDKMSIEDILGIYENKMVEIKDKFESDSEARGIQAGDGVDELLDRLKGSPNVGLPLNSPMLTAAASGARLKKFYIRSAPTGHGKSRNLIGDACKMSAKGWYDSKLGEWVQNQFDVNSVVISTEMLFEELQTPAIAYIADVEEDKILLDTMTEEEEERVRYAANILKSSNIFFEFLPNFDVTDIERTVEKNIIKNGVEYVFFDYIHSSISILSSFAKDSGINLREDQILLLMADKLKQICNKYSIFLMSATQLNGEWKEAWRKGQEIDQSFIRSSKGLIDKVDLAAIMLPLSNKEEKEIEEILSQGFYKKKPNFVTHIFKNRGNKHTKLKIFSYINMGTMRIVDLFACDIENTLIPMDLLEIKNKEVQEVDTE
ncbi:hypothetical protein CIL05_07535 [Virgibacillus profundi]|uniref:DNA 5'-3' helicase n=1 Tax=Virgibacillus profundi TaxID=2024555 RepID=A0A2A2IGU6_9BACI|nr:replicative DNA helicase [Virgibacillus profundi]PAV30313.1 hypothetical protein CIL05_07535 [Virgibacillus profundi]PXY54485.1 hypothetical protein CIT14_07620 [Virgibacillus profundi]